MAIFKPNQLSPQNTTIDATSDNTFSWVTNGTVQSGYRMYIYNNDTDALVYDSTEQVSPNQYHDVPALSLTNGIDYKWFVNTSGGGQDEDSEYEFFMTNDTPVVEFLEPDYSGGLNQVLEDFQDDSNWTAGNGIKTVNTTTYLSEYGTQSIYLYTLDPNQYLYMTKTVDLDLTEFDNGIVSNDSDEIYVAVYIVNKSRFTSDGVQIKFYTSGGNYFSTN